MKAIIAETRSTAEHPVLLSSILAPTVLVTVAVSALASAI